MNKLLKFLPRIIPGFPIILNTQTEIFKAEESGDLSFGMIDTPNHPQLPSRIRYIVSLLYEHPDGNDQNLFIHLKDHDTYPPSEERKAARQETWEKLNAVLQQLKSMDDQSSALLRYISSAKNKELYTPDLEAQARIELITMVLHQWNDKITIDLKFLECQDVFVTAKAHILKSVLFPDRDAFEKAKKYMATKVGNNPTLYHHSWGIGITLWGGIKKLYEEIEKPAFKSMLQKGEWSPAGFLAQFNVPPKSEFRVASRKTNLGGVLPYQINRGKFVILASSSAAENVEGLFLNSCSAANFILDLITFLVLRNNTADSEKICPYKNTITRPLY
ncbi:MAG: hypothetical protein ABI597_11480 [Gammaproteobacteria bacterium]